MNYPIAAWLALGVALFWSVGAYNRLVRLRSAALAAFQVLGEALAAYVVLVNDCFMPSSGALPVPTTQTLDGAAAATWVGLQAASTQFDASLQVARRQPLDAAGMAALQTALAVLQAAWRRAPSGFVERPLALPAALQAQWSERDQQVAHARAAFNRAVLAYNAAIAQFPAVLMARLFAFREAGCL